MNSLKALALVLLLLPPGRLLAQEDSITGETEAIVSLVSPEVADVTGLNKGSALIRWDEIDSGARDVIVELCDYEPEGFREVQTVEARRGWAVLEGLETHRAYKVRLTAVSRLGQAEPGKETSFNLDPPPVEMVFFPAGSYDYNAASAIGTLSDTAASSGEISNSVPLIPRKALNIRISAMLLSRGEITNAEYLRFCEEADYPLPEQPRFSYIKDYMQSYPHHPVVNVSWFDAVAFCNWLSLREGLKPAYNRRGELVNPEGVRLPTDAEWLRVASLAGGMYPWGNSPPGRDKAASQISTGMLPVGKPPTFETDAFPATSGGVRNLAGNVWEWCNDWYGDLPRISGLLRDPAGLTQGKMKVIRGGSWADEESKLRNSERGRLTPTVRLSTVGFRIARTVKIREPRVMTRSDIPRMEADDQGKMVESRPNIGR